jgi:hypothetical protein
LGSQAKKAPSGPFADKLWRDAIRKAALEQAEGKRGPKKLELAARALVNAAITGDVSAAKEMGDRLDGKVPQAHVGGDPDSQPIRVTRIELVDLA